MISATEQRQDEIILDNCSIFTACKRASYAFVAFCAVFRTSASDVYIQEQFEFLVIVLLFAKNLPSPKTSDSTWHTHVFVHEMLILFAVDLSISSKYAAPWKSVTKKRPHRESLKENCNIFLSLWLYVSTKNDARRICRTYTVSMAFSTGSGLMEKWLSSNDLLRLSPFFFTM